MAGVSGTEVLYKRESKLGLTTLTFRRRRYLFPDVAHQVEPHSLSASTGDLESRGRCVMLDVGLFCPHCAGAISAKLSGSQSKLVVSKAARREDGACRGAGTAPGRLAVGRVEERRIDVGFGSLDRRRPACRASSDYASLDRDGWSSCDNGTLDSTAPSRGDDAAYCSMTSSQMSATPDVGQRRPSSPRDVDAPAAVSEEELILDSMDVGTSDKNDDALVDELLSDDVVDEEYRSLVNGGVGQRGAARWEVDRQNNNVPSDEPRGTDVDGEDGVSERSASPETFVDDVLENIDSEVYPGDATLPRVFALHREGNATRDRSRRTPRADSRSNGEDRSKRNASPLKRRELHELIKAVYLNSQRERLSAAREDADFSHEAFFEDVVEALTDLEGGFATDWTSDCDSNNRCASPPPTPTPYRETVDGYGFRRTTTTSSCECIADDRSRDLDSSTERISSAARTPSELSAGSAEADGSSSECSGCGRAGSAGDGGRLFEQLVEGTRGLTDDLLVLGDGTRQGSAIRVIAPDKRGSPVADRPVRDDDVFADGDQPATQRPVAANSQSSNGGRVPVDVIRRVGPIEITVETCDGLAEVEPRLTAKTAARRSTGSESSDDVEVDDDDDDLENLLVCNAVHCSTSDLDEPYSAELRYVSGEAELRVEDSTRLSDLRTRQGKALAEVDEFVPETDEPRKEVIEQTLDAVENATLADSRRVPVAKEAEDGNQIAPRPNGTVTKRLVSSDLMKYVRSQSCKTHHSKEHDVRLDSCLDDVCQTCSFQPKGPNEFIKNEEVTTQEVVLEFVWPKKMKKFSLDRELAPKQPYRSVHLRRVMRVSDFDVDVVEGPTVETVEYRKDGATRRSIVQRPSEASAIRKPEDEKGISESSETNQSEGTAERRTARERHRNEQHSHAGTAEGHRDSEEQTGGATCERSGSDESDSDNGTGSLADIELSHYNRVSQSFVMPSVDMTASQKSGELFDLSSAASMELLSESESTVDRVYSGHQRTVDAVYERAESGSRRDENPSDGHGSTVDALETTRPDEPRSRSDAEAASPGTEAGLDEERDRDRESRIGEGNDPNLTMIDQSERNVYVVSVGKYFTGRADDRLDAVPDPWPAGGNDFGSESREATCPRCENVIVVRQSEEARDAPRTAAAGGRAENRPRHPVPCERCIRLEREIRIKLAELSRLIEEIGRRRQLRRNERSSSVEDLESLSQETAENIRILQRSIAMLNDDGDEGTPGARGGCGPEDAPLAGRDGVPRRRSPHAGAVSYSTKVIKKRRAKKATRELREIFRETPRRNGPEEGTPAQVNQLSDLSSASDAGSQSRGERLTEGSEGEETLDGMPPTGVRSSADVHSPEIEQPDSSVVADIGASVSDEMPPVANEMPADGYQNKLETFAENLAKYIIFRAKLFIVLENPETRIPYLKNELAPPSDSRSSAPEEAEHVTRMTSGSHVGGTAVVHDRKTGESNVSPNESGVGLFTNIGVADVGVRERIRQVAGIQARIEYNMRKIREKMAALKALKVVQEETLHAESDSACPTAVLPSGGGVENDSRSGSMALESARSPFTNSVCRLSDCESSRKCDDSNSLQARSELQSECLNCERLQASANLSEASIRDKRNENIACFAECEKNVLLPSVSQFEENVTDVVRSLDECDTNLTDASASVDRCEPGTTDALPSLGTSEPDVTDMPTSGDDFGQAVSDMLASDDRCETDGTSVDRFDQNVTQMASSVDGSDAQMTEVAPSDGRETLVSSVDESDGAAMAIAPCGYRCEDNVLGVDMKMLESAEKLRQVIRALSLDEVLTGDTSDADCVASTDATSGTVQMTGNDENVDRVNKAVNGETVNTSDAFGKYNTSQSNRASNTQCSKGSVTAAAAAVYSADAGDICDKTDECNEECRLAHSTGKVTHRIKTGHISPLAVELADVSENQYATTSVTGQRIDVKAYSDTQRQGCCDDDGDDGGGGGTNVNKEDGHDNGCGGDVADDDHRCDNNRFEDTRCKGTGCDGDRCGGNSTRVIGSEQKVAIQPAACQAIACLETINGSGQAVDEEPIAAQETNQGEELVADGETTANIQPMRAQQSTSHENDVAEVQPISDHVSNEEPMANEQHSQSRTRADNVEKMRKILDFLDVYKSETASDNIDDVSSVASSDVSDTSVSTIIHVPCSSGPKHDHQTASTSEQKHPHARRDERARSPTQQHGSVAPPTDLVSNIREPGDPKRQSNGRGQCVSRVVLQVKKETPLPCYVSHWSSFRSGVTRVIPEGVAMPGQHGRCRRPNVRCIPLANTHEARVYGNAKSAEAATTVKRFSPRPVGPAERYNGRPAGARHSDDGRRNVFLATGEEDDDGAANGSRAETTAAGERDNGNALLLDYAGGAARRRGKHGKRFTSLAGLLGDGDVAEGSVRARRPASLRRARSCDAIRSEGSAARFERAARSSDSLPLAGGGWTSRKSAPPPVRSCVACLGDERPTAVRAGELPRTTCSRLPGVVLLERRWSEADLGAIKQSMDRGPEAAQSDAVRRLRDPGDNANGEEGSVHTARPKPDFSPYVNYYAPYFESRKSRLPNRRCQIRVSPDPRVASGNRRRAASLSPARSRTRCNRAKIKKYPI